MKRQFDLNALQTFAVAVHKGSMAKAAAVLGLPKSTVSRHLAKIEEAMGTSLIQRVPHGIEPTVQGKLLFDRIADSVLSLQASSATMLFGSDQRNNYDTLKPLRVRAPIVFGRGFLPDLVAEAMVKFPALRFEIALTDRIFDPSDDAYDINFCVGIDIPFEMESWPLGYLKARLYASPDFIARQPINKPDDINESPLITIPCTTDAASILTLTSQQGQRISVASKPLAVVNDNAILLHLAKAGHGICRLPAFLAAPHLKAGTLVDVLPDWWVDRHRIFLAVKRGYRQAVVQDFIEFAASTLSRKLSHEEVAQASATDKSKRL
ncbi:MAG: LysR family transcriptional regulator [Sphingorhabdus sp.]